MSEGVHIPPDLIVAAHESGHVASALADSIKVEGVELVKTGRGFRGITYTTSNYHSPLSRCAVSFGGMEAERLLTRSPFLSFGCLDTRNIERYVRSMGLKPVHQLRFLDQAHALAQRRLAKWWDLVENLSCAILEHDGLTGAQVKKVFERTLNQRRTCRGR